MQANYDYKTKEWYIETPVAMSYPMRVRVVVYLKETYRKRISGEIGIKKRRMQEAVDQLTINSLKERFTTPGEKTLYLEPGKKL